MPEEALGIIEGAGGLNYKRISEWVWVSFDGEFIREDDLKRLIGWREGQKLPRVFRRVVGYTAQAHTDAPEHTYGQVLEMRYEALKFSSMGVWSDLDAQHGITREPEPINNRAIIGDLKKQDKYAYPRCYPAVEFLVDTLQEYDTWQIKPGAQVYGRRWCHLMSMNGDKSDLHWFAEQIGLRRCYFQDSRLLWHYDLTPKMREKALAMGAKEITTQELHEVYLNRRRKLL